MKILVINGPNLNMLGKREPHIYGNAALDDLISFIKDTFRENFEIEFFQSNHEGEIIDKLHEASDIFDGTMSTFSSLCKISGSLSIGMS